MSSIPPSISAWLADQAVGQWMVSESNSFYSYADSKRKMTIYQCICVYIGMYMYIDLKKQKHASVYIIIYIYVYVRILYIYIYENV